VFATRCTHLVKLAKTIVADGFHVARKRSNSIGPFLVCIGPGNSVRQAQCHGEHTEFASEISNSRTFQFWLLCIRLLKLVWKNQGPCLRGTFQVSGTGRDRTGTITMHRGEGKNEDLGILLLRWLPREGGQIEAENTQANFFMLLVL
jgi:hypothetical protein